MSTIARFDLKMDAAELNLVARAADLTGTTMAGFVLAAAKEKALLLLDCESRVTMSRRDFAVATRALEGAFTPNEALKSALRESAKIRRA